MEILALGVRARLRQFPSWAIYWGTDSLPLETKQFRRRCRACEMIHVGIDATSWTNNRGFGRFTRELVKALARRSEGFRYTLLFDQETPKDVPDGVDAINARPTRTLSQSAVGTTSRSLGYLWSVSSLARRTKFDVFFFPAVYSYFPVLTRVPCVVCYHDTTAERFPKLVFPTRWNQRLWQIKTALARFQTTRAMTVSEASARDLEEVFHIPKRRIDVITEGADPVFRLIQDSAGALRVRAQHGIPPDAELLVYVGGINPHKNLLGLLKALPEILAARSKAHLAIVGDTSGKGFWDNIDELKGMISADVSLTRHVHFMGYMPDSELAEFLNGAAALVFPSLWEGFGLPAVEAMSCGLPVLASRRASLPEVVGDAGLFFDPEIPSEIASCTLRFLRDPELRIQLRKTALERARLFTWDRAAELARRSFQRCHEEGGLKKSRT